MLLTKETDSDSPEKIYIFGENMTDI
jgi:hypothetical protein